MKPRPRKGASPAELEYRRTLRRALSDVQAQIYRYLEPKIEAYAKRTDALPSRFSVAVDPKELDRVFGRVDKTNEAEQKRLIGIKTQVPKRLLASFRKENVTLIKSLADYQLNEISDILDEGFATGKRVETIRKEIEDKFSVARSKADLLARDQVLKLNADMAQARQAAAGITEYVWSASADERVRDMHLSLDGSRQSWDDPPATNEAGDTNHPGQDYQCRCVAIPVLPWEE
jgi:SPP1 gp7 family putative phage head morphogenesis protein